MKLSLFAFTLLSILSALPSQAQTPPTREMAADTWVATDALGRSLPTAAQTRTVRKDRFVGIFYFVWQSRSATTPFDNTQALAADAAHPVYGPVTAFHWWGEPAVGYYRADDPWVARKNLQMLGAAGVDVLFLDMTNAAVYPNDVKTLFDTATQMRREGTPTPQIAFITHAHTVPTVTKLYQTYYANGLYKDLWFRWENKPLMLGDQSAKEGGEALDPKITGFFTWRNSWAWDPGQDKWQWIDKYPQRAGWHTDPKSPEEVPVSVAGHPTDNLGRSYQSEKTWGHGTEPPVDAQWRTADSDKGLQFSQQWRQALTIDPQFIFVTGWNEWIAQRFTSGAGGGPNFLGRTLKPGETFFVDNYNEEFSRDAMPMKGGYGDNYYLQLVDGIRRFKGVHALPVAHGFRTLNSAFTAWNSVKPTYLDAIGDTLHRNHDGWGKRHYSDTSGRNDIIRAKVACDAKNMYFYVQTQAPLTAYTDPNWMQLLIDADCNPKTGWNGYDFVVNSRVLDGRTTMLKRLSDGKTWPIRYRVVGNQMAVTIPRRLLRLTNMKRTAFDFHWADNVPVCGDPGASPTGGMSATAPPTDVSTTAISILPTLIRRNGPGKVAGDGRQRDFDLAPTPHGPPRRDLAALPRVPQADVIPPRRETVQHSVAGDGDAPLRSRV